MQQPVIDTRLHFCSIEVDYCHPQSHRVMCSVCGYIGNHLTPADAGTLAQLHEDATDIAVRAARGA